MNLSLKSGAALRVLLPVCLGTAFSLLGDTTLYTVLSTHTGEAGVVFASVGLLLSINRWVRLPLNSIAGRMIEGRPRKPFFVAALFLGTLSTAVYGLKLGYPAFLAARAAWGIAWVGIWIVGTTIVLDISGSASRGRFIGIYQVAFFTGAGGGSILGGLLTDAIGYSGAMLVNTALTLAGAVIALLFLPETRPQPTNAAAGKITGSDLSPSPEDEPTTGSLALFPPGRKGEGISGLLLMAVNRFGMEGLLLATFAVFLQQLYGPEVVLAGRTLGTSTLTGLSLGAMTLFSMIAAPISGAVSDRLSSRWGTAAAWLFPGTIGFFLLPIGVPLAILAGLFGIASAASSSSNLATALMGDLGSPRQQGRRLGVLFTVGDLASASGPVLAFALLGWIGLNGVYWLAGTVFFMMFTVALYWTWASRRLRAGPLP